MKTTRPNPPLDDFESALLTELRSFVSERETTLVAAPRAKRTIRRKFTYVAAASAAALAVTVGPSLNIGQTTVSGPSSAFAIDEQANGDIVITIHRLEDADQLEKDLASFGIPAEVTFDSADGSAENVLTDAPRSYSFGDSCGDLKDNLGPEQLPASLDRKGLDYVLTIPADSVLRGQDKALGITLSAGVYSYRIDDDVAPRRSEIGTAVVKYGECQATTSVQLIED